MHTAARGLGPLPRPPSAQGMQEDWSTLPFRPRAPLLGWCKPGALHARASAERDAEAPGREASASPSLPSWKALATAILQMF